MWAFLSRRKLGRGYINSNLEIYFNIDYTCNNQYDLFRKSQLYLRSGKLMNKNFKLPSMLQRQQNDHSLQ